MKPFRILGRNIRDAVKSVFRNFSLSIASITCIVITLLLVSVSAVITQNVNSFIQDLQDELTIVVFAEHEADEEEIRELYQSINNLNHVESVVHDDKHAVKEEMMKEHEAFELLMAGWDEDTNPLLDRFKVRVDEVYQIQRVAVLIGEMDNVNSVTYGERVISQILPIFRVVERAAIIMVIALILVTAFLISNTIKLTIYSRRTEIEIMRLVGTGNLVIKLPFLFEGLILGIIGSIIPVIVSIYGYIILYDNLNGYIFSNIFKLISPKPFVFYLAGLIVLIGAVVGMFGSWRAVRKYLKI